MERPLTSFWILNSDFCILTSELNYGLMASSI
jgi:hypothetical protein